MKIICGNIFNIILLLSWTVAVQANETNSTGNANVAAKVVSLSFIDSEIRKAGSGTATLFGLEGYASVAPNLHLGGEVGYTRARGSRSSIEFGTIHTEITFIPVEINLKSAVELTRNVFMDFGGGLSCNYVHYQARGNIPFFGMAPVGETRIQDVPDWLIGWQFFVGVNYSAGAVFLGLNGKIQAVVPGESDNYSGVISYQNYTNARLSGQLGIRF